MRNRENPPHSAMIYDPHTQSAVELAGEVLAELEHLRWQLIAVSGIAIAALLLALGALLIILLRSR